MNMAVNKVIESPIGSDKNRLGTTDQASIKESPAANSNKKTNILIAIKIKVKTGTVRRALLSSPTGHIVMLLLQ
jgi:hypothetical protein